MFIFIGCAGGGTSSMFCQRIVKEIQKNDPNMTAVFDDVLSVHKKQRAYGEAYDLVFAYGGISAIRSYTAYEFGSLFDVVFVAPQVRHLASTAVDLLSTFPTIVKTIPMKLFGMMDGAAAYDDLVEELMTLDEQRAYESSIHSTTKRIDKNMEIFMLNADRKDAFFKNLLAELESLGVRCMTELFSLESLYKRNFTEDFDIRFVFGQYGSLREEDFPRIARRIDGVISLAQNKSAFAKKLRWLTDYRIPCLQLERSDSDHLEREQLNAIILDFLIEVQFQTEFASEISVDYLEKQELKKRKSFLGIISWE